MADFTSPDKLQVFLCHSSGDKKLVRALYQKLSAETWLYPWLDEEELLPGQDWDLEIERALEKSHVIIVCLTPAAITREGYVHREIRFALELADYMPEGSIKIIPVLLEPCENIPRRLRRWQWATYYEERGHERLLRSLKLRAAELKTQEENPPPPKPPTPIQPPEEKIIVTPPPPVETEQARLIKELGFLNTTHQRRLAIGDKLAAIGDTRPGVGVRKDGLPDIAWCPVFPGGEITLKIDGEPQSFKVAPFFIAQYPVTYAQYEAFVKAEDGFDNPVWWQGFPKEYQRQKLAEQYHKGSNKPRDKVSWYQAVAFCRWLYQRLQGWKFTFPNNSGVNEPLIIGQNAEIRLPLEWEWQWAAQGGSEKRDYPWGQWQEGYANTAEAGLKQTTAVGMYPQGAAICGAMDLSGNVWEWCLNKWQNPKDMIIDMSTRSVRGGAYHLDSNNAACVYRHGDGPGGDFGSGLGFRVVAPPY
jgi:formylglycine-generating enzyme required for sulfatase activity